MDPKMDPNTSSVYDHDTKIVFANRSIVAVATLFIGVVFIIGLIIWWFFGAPTGFSGHKKVVQQDGQTVVINTQEPGNRYEEDTGRSAVYDFFYNVFGGARDGLRENPLAIDNLDEGGGASIGQDLAYLELVARATAAKMQSMDDGYRRSLFDVVGSNVIGAEGEEAGEIHDILIDKKTGQAHALILDKDGLSRTRDLTALKFNKVDVQNPGGSALLNVTDGFVEGKDSFTYDENDKKSYISLRHLRAGQIIDYNGNVAGQVDAIIYENAEAQRIFFELKPRLVPQGKPAIFGLAYEDARIVTRPDGYDVILDKEQTELLAETLFAQDSQENSQEKLAE